MNVWCFKVCICSLTQPAITQGLAKLETIIGQPLFERHPEGMTATGAAQLLVPRIDAAQDVEITLPGGFNVSPRLAQALKVLPGVERIEDL